MPPFVFDRARCLLVQQMLGKPMWNCVGKLLYLHVDHSLLPKLPYLGEVEHVVMRVRLNCQSGLFLSVLLGKT